MNVRGVDVGRGWLVFGLLLAWILPGATRGSAAWAAGDAWRLVWADEFEGPQIEDANWTYDLGAGGWGNRELQSYTRSNAFIEEGALVIEARRTAANTYTSARLKTQGLHAWRYGKVAARIRLPRGQGIWPAFWMLGENIGTIGWPKCGEIDIMEMIGGGENRDDSIYGTLHWDANNTHASYGSGAHELPDPQFFHEDFHVFEIEWSRTEVIWKLDGVKFFSASIDTAAWPTMEEFHQPFFIVLNVAVGGDWPGYPDATTVLPQRMTVDWVRVYERQDPYVAEPPASQVATVGGSVTLAASGGGTPPYTYQWRRAGVDRPGATGATLTLARVGADDASLYDVIVTNSRGSTASTPAIVGVLTTSKVIGAGTEFGAPNIRHPNGNVFDQVLVTGAATAVTADHDLNQITRVSFVDLDDDIVQVELAGPGTLSLVLDSASGPAVAEKYQQPEVPYMKGHAGIVIAGATERTDLAVFSVGRKTAVNQALFKDGLTYDGVADLAFIAIHSADGKFGGLRMANATLFAHHGQTGIHAPGVAFSGPVYVGDISAFDAARPVFVLGSASDVRVAGGDLLQANGQPVQVSGITQLKFTAGSDSHGHGLPVQTNRAVFEQDGQDVTSQIVSYP